MEDEKGWLAEQVQCDLCGYKWTAVYHEDSDRLECNQCGNMAIFKVVTENRVIHGK